MADFRQGLEPMHPQGRNEVEDGADRGFLFPRGMRVAQGKKLWAAPLQLGARGAAVPCQSKPLTRTWMSAAGQ
ncbi:MAG: hypothetical protein COA41_06170 [Sphingopyxis sp.]|nr:MAG: hypothetical protein COA41_06170 [Sphingopyxis sp.]